MVENVPPGRVWEALQNDPNAQLVDVRTDAEWNFVGVPDLVAAGKQAVLVPWQVYPTMQRNAAFADQLKEAGFTAGAPHLLHLSQRPAQPRRGPGGAGGRLPECLQRRRRVRGRSGRRRPPRRCHWLEGGGIALAATLTVRRRARQIILRPVVRDGRFDSTRRSEGEAHGGHGESKQWRFARSAIAYFLRALRGPRLTFSVLEKGCHTRH